MTAPLFLAELVAYDPGVPGTVTLRYASRKFVTAPGDTPANTIFEDRLKQPAVLRRDMFDARTTGGASRVGYGDLVLLNGDGFLDALAAYGFDGRAITVWVSWDRDPTYPTDFTKLLVGTMEQIEIGRETVTVKLRDRQLAVQVPLQTTKYAGDNALPAGLEGIEDDLKGKPKPLCFGAVRNVPAVLVNTSKLIYQVHDGAITSLGAVYDRGIRLGNNFDLWTLVDEPADAIRGMAFVTDDAGAARLFAVGDAGTIVYTENGTTWFDETGDWSTTNINAIGAGLKLAAGEAVAVAGGASGTMYIYETANLASGQGTSVTSQFGASAIRAVRYWEAQHLWIAVGDDGKISTSADGGQTWTARTSGVATALYAIAVSQNLIVVAGASGVIRTSPDGTTWTSRTSGFSTSAIYGAVYGGSQFVVVGADSKVARSANGTLWVLETGGLPVQRAVLYADGLYVVVGDEEDVSVSSDGATWTPRAEGASTEHYYAVGQIPNGAVCAGGEDTLTAGIVYRCTVPGSYASAAQLEDEDLAPLPGTYKTYLAGGYFRLGAPPAGLITADVTQGAAAANRTAGQLFAVVLQRAGFTTGDWSAADVTALDTANNDVLGFWTADEMSCAELLDLLAESVGAWWGLDRTGVFRIAQFTAPSGTPVGSYGPNDFLRPLERITPNDGTRGLPVYRTIVRWGRVYAVQDRDVALGVSETHRAFVSKQWREAVATNTAVQTKHLLAPQTVEDSLLTTETDAQAEATRRQTLRGTGRHPYVTTLPLDAETVLLDLGNVVTITHPRYGLSAGRDMRILGLEPDAKAERLGLVLWG